jgi:LAO/AO transport system kinase
MVHEVAFRLGSGGRYSSPVTALIDRVLSGDERALARALTLVESGEASGLEVLSGLRGAGRRARVLGVTGAPGSGKSSLTDRLIAVLRERGERVAVVAVDPSSPFTGGAILGDRIRMGRHHADRGVFVRSMASRGQLGGLARATVSVASVLEAARFDTVIIETVGVGQSEVDIARAADHTVLVLTPAGGDAVQAFKAGIMEVADVFAINKADLPGADRLEREVRAALELGPHDEHTWWPPIVKTVATDGSGAAELLAATEAHRAHLGAAGLEEKRLDRARFEVSAAVADEVRRLSSGARRDLLRSVAGGALTADAAARQLLDEATRG